VRRGNGDQDLFFVEAEFDPKWMQSYVLLSGGEQVQVKYLVHPINVVTYKASTKDNICYKTITVGHAKLTKSPEKGEWVNFTLLYEFSVNDKSGLKLKS
jgi:hypothetical protein